MCGPWRTAGFVTDVEHDEDAGHERDEGRTPQGTALRLSGGQGLRQPAQACFSGMACWLGFRLRLCKVLVGLRLGHASLGRRPRPMTFLTFLSNAIAAGAIHSISEDAA